jgi:succinate dehydrogenase / fumarate reductase cytochrome b subunit
MKLLQQIWRSALGKKYVMAFSGAGLFLFAVAHMLGNLQFFLPPTFLNAYGHFLQSTPEILWPARLGLLAMVGSHIAAAISLSALNRSARPIGYQGASKPYAASAASRTMIYSGSIIAAFIVYHLLHYTVTVPAVNGLSMDLGSLREPGTGHHDVFAMIVLGFSQPAVAVFYIISVGLLCLHLGHGVASMFQSLGMRDHVWGPRIAAFARVASLALFLGYAAVPVAVMCGRGATYVNEVVDSTSKTPMVKPVK